MSQMKNFYEMEKSQMESRINEEKDRATRRIQTMQDGVESRIAESTREKDCEIEFLQDQLANLEQHQQALTAQVESELTLKNQTIENLEHQLSNVKQRLQSHENSKAMSFDRQVEHFETQRVELNAKIDKLMAEHLEKDKQISAMTLKLDRNTDALNRKTADLDQARD